MGMFRDRVDFKSVYNDFTRAANAGGPREIAKDYGRPRGSDRFPGKRPRPSRSVARSYSRNKRD